MPINELDDADGPPLLVGEVARISGVTVRTLHHYDQIGLVQPRERDESGYRLYNHDDLERLQTVLFYRELGFSLGQIGRMLSSADLDRGAALREQKRLLQGKARHLERMIGAIEDAIEAHGKGMTMTHQAMFEVFGKEQRARWEEARQIWEGTDAWAVSNQRAAGYTKSDWEEIRAESAAITDRISDVYRSGSSPRSEEAVDAVEEHRLQIVRRFYDCSREMHASLADLYVDDPRFRAGYEAIEAGLAEWVRDAVRANAARVD